MKIKSSNGNFIGHKIHRFPDGEVQIELDPIDRKCSYDVTFKITNAEELFLADQVMDILDRQEVVYNVLITYLMGMRMDRVMSFERPFTLKLVASVFKKHNIRSIHIFESHNEAITNALFGSNYVDLYDIHLHEFLNNDQFQIMLPDEGAAKRYGWRNPECIYGIKHRDIETGKIVSLEIKNPEDIDGRPIIIVDDLCDGGGTFVGLYHKLKEIAPDVEINLYVSHMVNSEGLKKVCNLFNHVYTTNSYKDWSGYDNLTVYEI